MVYDKHCFKRMIRNYLRHECNCEDVTSLAERGYHRFIMGLEATTFSTISNSINEVGITWEEIGYCSDEVLTDENSYYKKPRLLYVTYDATNPVAFYSNEGKVVEASGRCTTYFDEKGQPYGTKRNNAYFHIPFDKEESEEESKEGLENTK